MTPKGVQAWIAVIVRDAVIPLLGAYLTYRGYVNGTLEPWHLPLLAGMMAVPLVGHLPSKPDQSDGRPPPAELPEELQQP